jgi:hypothetical protein
MLINTIKLKTTQLLNRDLENMRDLEDIIYGLSVYHESNLTIDLILLRKMYSVCIELLRTILNRMEA